MNYPSGNRYEGMIRNGEPNGKGTYFFVNGDKFVGSFKDSQFHGYGKMFYSDGRTLSGYWKEDEFVAERKFDVLRDGFVVNQKT